MTIEEARELVADAALWPRIRDFLWNFAPQIHPSWIEGIGRAASGAAEGEPAESLGPSVMSSPRVRRFVLGELGVEPCFHAFPGDDWSRILLLDGATLESMAKWLGALAMSDELRLVMDGKAVRALKAALPGVYPEVFMYTAYFRGVDFRREGAKAHKADLAGGEAVSREGAAIISGVLAGLPEPLVMRLRLKLPKGLCDSATSRLKPETCGKVLAKLLKLKFPEAYRLCC